MSRVLLLCAFTLCSFYVAAQNVVQYVQTLSGTAASTTQASLKHGGGTELNANTIPSVTMPFAMTQWTPQTRFTEKKCLPPYFYKDSLFSGFRGTHWLSGSCVQDYGSVTIMPITGKLNTSASSYPARFSHENETATPYLYSVKLPRYQLTASVTSTLRCGLMRFKVDKNDSLYILITPNSDQAGAYINIDQQKGEITGYNPVHRIYQGWGQPAGFSGYFVIRFQKPIAAAGVFTTAGHTKAYSIKNIAGAGAYAGMAVQKGEEVLVRVGTSFSSIEGARNNLEAELPGFDFDETSEKCRSAWQSALSKILVTGDSEKNKRIFYTALYHAMQHPRLYNDVDGTYPLFSSDYKLGKMPANHNYYDDMSMWDIYRAQLPLLEILFPAVVNDVVQSLILKGQQGGWMPIFPCWNSYTAAMIGDHTAPVIASAFTKGISKQNATTAYSLLRQNAFDTPADTLQYINGKGRRALNSYIKYGYIPLEDSVPHAFHKKEQVSRTLEYAYDDYAVAQLAKLTGNPADYHTLMQRAGNYANVFDTSVNLVRGRFANGAFIQNFSPDKKELFITEGTPRQYTFYVPHNVAGLAKLMGGKKQLENGLDSLFTKGEYWHGNEPGHQIPFMYNFTSAPWKTQAAVQNILEEEYSDGAGGLSGNDDSGQMSAWYVFAAMGFYPVDPVSGNYQVSTPLFNTVTINADGKTPFVIRCNGVKTRPAYIQSLVLNNQQLTEPVIQYNNLVNGGQLNFTLQERHP